jgi:hypothetical protein
MKKFLLGIMLLSSLTAFGADKKISDLTLLPAASFATGDLVPIVDVSASETKKTTIGDFDLRYQALGNYLTGLSGDVSASGPGVGVATISSLARSKLANGTANYVLINNGSGAPSEEATLAVSRGGTNLASGTSGGVLAYTASGVLASSAALTANQLVIGGGPGVVPSSLAAGSQYQVLRMGAANPAYGSINLDQAAAVTGILPNANTTGTASNTNSTLVLRDGSGNFSAGTITAALTGNASTATALAANPADCLSDTYATTIAASGALTCASITNASTTGTAVNTPSTLVLRDGSGNFAAGTITAALTGNASTATALAANPADCLADTYATTIAASGALTCATVTNAGLAGSIAASKLVGSDIATVGTITSGTWSGTTVAVNKGGTDQTSYTDGQLLIGNTSGNTLTKATLTAGSNITITNGNGSIQIAASSSAIPAYTYVSQTSTLNPAVLGRYYKLSGTSFNITLPDATAGGAAGQDIWFEFDDTSLANTYCFLTTSAQTLNDAGGSVASGDYCLFTKGERIRLVDDGAGWQVGSHDTATPEVDAGALWISKSSAYSFTIGSASITAGTVYTNNGCTFIVSTTTSASTNLLAYGTCAPAAATATLTFVSGSPSGNRSYTAISTAGAYIKPTTALFDRFVWYRTGQYVNYRWEAAFTNSGTAGTGDDLVFLPTGLPVDTTNMNVNTVIGGATAATFWSEVGQGHVFASGVNMNMTVHPAWPGTLKGQMLGNGSWSTGSATFNSTPRWSIVGRYPVGTSGTNSSKWRP